MTKLIAHELKEHIPFTALGAATGILLTVIVLLSNVPNHISDSIFHTFHPLHVVLSALATTAMYMRYKKGRIWAVILIGWTGSIGIATISDAIIPYLGGTLLHIPMEFEVPFIEHWWVNLMALVGIGIGYWKQTTKIPHFGHVLLSTWASLFYILAFGHISDNWIPLLPFIFLILFVAVWLPCCLSDVVYPLLFLGKKTEPASSERREIVS